MITVKPFFALRPSKELAHKCAALPYDVMSSREAREMVKGDPYTFLRVDRAEVNLPLDTDIYSDIVYQTAKATLDKMENDGVYINDTERKYYFYRQIMNGHSQTGIVGCASIDDYLENRIKKHEFTRADKEIDRIRHVDTVSAHTGPIFLTYKDSSVLDEIIEKQTQGAPIYDFVAEDGVRHTVWTTDGENTDKMIENAFSSLDALYIADGHHRCASAVKVGLKRREENKNHTGNEEYNFFLSVIFPSKSLAILDYNRLLKDLNGYSARELLSIIQEKVGDVCEFDGEGPYKPTQKHTVGIYLEGKWYAVKFHKEICKAEKAVDRLDCAILQKHLLSAILGIDDPRSDKRIDFAGGIRGLEYLEKRCQEDMKMAISMYPTSLDDLMAVADNGDVMPPKSTWFEPKLRSGLLIHKI
ncbi:MAG: DUF1015 domain-containing protein [Ruminococcaceae bacterium]|nr:DUF1015 domain-containing protein [Oscillospiraceae bacterium]